MADWQVAFHIVPRRAVAAAPQPLTPAALADRDWWADARFPPDFGVRLSAIASAAPALHAELEAWGDEGGNRVEVWSRGGRVQRVTVRVDVRRLDSKFGAALILLVRAADAVLFRADGVLVEPTIAAYAAALRGSSAWRFANDPMTSITAQRLADDDE